MTASDWPPTSVAVTSAQVATPPAGPVAATVIGPGPLNDGPGTVTVTVNVTSANAPAGSVTRHFTRVEPARNVLLELLHERASVLLASSGSLTAGSIGTSALNVLAPKPAVADVLMSPCEMVGG